MQIKFESVNHIYNANTPMERRALYNIEFDVPKGQFLAIIGHTGSGKSTLIQHMNGLLKPSSGNIKVGDKVIKSDDKNRDLREIRQHVGLVFQFPEYQLFEETIERDIIFGPMNYGVSEEEAIRRAHDVIQMVGLDIEMLGRSPFNLSGGQMRRVAIAGILAMDPDILVLDEPTAGLDPRGQFEIMEMFYKLNKEYGKTIVLVTHDMDLVAKYAEEVIVMNKGVLTIKGTPKNVFKQVDLLRTCGITLPIPSQNYYKLLERLNVDVDNLPLTEEEFIGQVESLLGGGE
ncbi:MULTISPECIES: energy-coupling factor ABC transporter ATP-binding protein [Turicibacter]|uniref:Energy-coupling factor transporter ATP-binding protein EcfA2 n=1 Tax=Turicibacter faecis TaxID=2963365 RepID=A0ABM8IP47_9FIRM|nr:MULTISPECIES: energy-coupling factor ABC transporter ATP-binding protein [unclassified Turicibacter]MCU7205304.1 energy-coupling factor ABC transporter ATP-binding protein [Turicibacter sp. TA25]MCU7208323.1 energy-coupling factor ABC transporter ATP-binding protein [Turicibacter sp. 1E2]NCE79207.1 energy-coupling factor ABC transporter ATP-binding protein [Turicibacter sp. TS3]BEH91785.1 energy-coupling factor transporter ATP-binding protein EcfA2 [Turicibacter sp. TC023]